MTDISNAPITQELLARTFIEKNEERLRFDHSRGQWYRWTGTLWSVDETEATFNEIREHIKVNVAPHNKSMLTASFTQGVERLARSDQRISVTSRAWNPDKMLLGTPNHTIDLRSGAIIKSIPANMITKSTAVDPSDTTSCPRWFKFLEEATNGDRALIDFLQRLCGYALTGETSEQVFCFIHGPGGNGKSVFQNVVKGIAGSYGETAAIETFMASRSDQHPTGVAKLDGARIVIASETEDGRYWRTSLIKRLTGGDPIAARFLYKNEFEFDPQFLLIIVGNNAPQLGKVDEAMKRRVLIIPFRNKPATIDKELEQKLRHEWPGILRWMLDGNALWQQQGLNPPKAVSDATDEYFEQEDVFSQWLDEFCERGPERVLPVAEAFQSWKTFCLERAFDPGTEKTFARQMESLGLERKVRAIASKQTKCWIGVSLR
jgi:putative DNA primase/helicase